MWWRDARLTIINPEASTVSFRVVEKDDGEIQGHDVGAIAERNGSDTIDLLKLDIEGTELELFRHEVSGWLGRVRVLAVELHERYAPGCTEAFERALAGRDHNHSQSGQYEVVRFLD